MRYDVDTILEVSNDLKKMRHKLAVLRVGKCSGDFASTIQSASSSFAVIIDALEAHANWSFGRALCFLASEWEIKHPERQQYDAQIVDTLAEDEVEYPDNIDFDYRLLSTAYDGASTADELLSATALLTTTGVVRATEIIAASFECFKSGRAEALHGNLIF